MPINTVAHFAVELKMPANVLLEQLRSAGVELKSVDEAVTDADKAKLLESLRRAHGGSEGKKITLTRRQTSEIRQADGSGRSRTIQVEVRKKRVFVKRDPAELINEAARADAEAVEVAEQAVVADVPEATAIESADQHAPAAEQQAPVAEQAAAPKEAEPASVVAESEAKPAAPADSADDVQSEAPTPVVETERSEEHK